MLKIISLSATLLAWPLITNMADLEDDHFTAAFNFQYKPDLIPANKTTINQPAVVDTAILKQGGWYAEAIRKLKQDEYGFRNAAEKDEYITSNRRNNLLFTYSANGFRVKPRLTKFPVDAGTRGVDPDDLKYTILPDWEIAFNLDKKQIDKGVWEITGNQATYQTESIDVQYINNEEGMRQNFIIIRQRPALDSLCVAPAM